MTFSVPHCVQVIKKELFAHDFIKIFAAVSKEGSGSVFLILVFWFRAEQSEK